MSQKHLIIEHEAGDEKGHMSSFTFDFEPYGEYILLTVTLAGKAIIRQAPFHRNNLKAAALLKD